MSDEKRARWMRKMLLLVDDFQHIDNGTQTDDNFRLVLASMLRVMLPQTQSQRKSSLAEARAMLATEIRRCEKYPDCECEIWEVCGPALDFAGQESP